MKVFPDFVRSLWLFKGLYKSELPLFQPFVHSSTRTLEYFSEVTHMRAIVIEVSRAICLMNSMLGAVLSGQHPSGDEVLSLNN